ncbi:MAG: AEC family transporter [Candidatus Omnitrophica bacterium]|nr:AEC family transporter [Candidatus Omnitrophota bacterium]MCM8829265.1 AEC family transporter [Candidatus Omnitrophota bacterium]
MFFSVFIRVLSIFSIILAGAIARRKNFLTDETTSVMAACVTNFFYPALIVSSITSGFTIESLVSNWLLPAGTMVIMFTGYLVGVFFIKFLSFEDMKQKNTFLFQCTINNYVFLPLPVVVMFLGNTGVAHLIFSSFGSEISVWTIGILGLTGNRLERKNLRNLVSVPMISLIFAIFIIIIRDAPGFNGFIANEFLKSMVQSVSTAIDMFGKATVPLALFLAGSRMSRISRHQLRTINQFWITFLRLILIPAVACAAIAFFPVSYEVFLVLAIVAIMPSAIASIILSDTYKADIEFASASVLITHIASLLTVPAWLTFLVK